MNKLTAKQQEVYNYLYEYVEEQDNFPCRRQIAHALGKTVSSIQSHMKALEAKGAIEAITTDYNGESRRHFRYRFTREKS